MTGFSFRAILQAANLLLFRLYRTVTQIHNERIVPAFSVNSDKHFSMYKKDKKALVLTALVILLLGISAAALYFQNRISGAAKTALIYQDGQLLHEIDLSHVAKPYTFTIEAPGGGCNTIRVEQGRIGISEADCPDKICQKMGMVETSSYPISCLPHKLLIKISSADGGLDAVAQ